jgi:sugar lactone lactonase YvrE
MSTGVVDNDRFSLLAPGFSLVECPVVDGRGGLHFTDAMTGELLHLDADGNVEVVETGRVCGGMVANANGNLVYSGPSIAERRGPGDWRPLFELEEPDGVVVTFNDMTALPDGSLVSGTLRWPPRPDGAKVATDLYGPNSIPQELWRVRGEGQAEIAYQPVGLSNGVNVHPDGASIYFADTKHASVLHLRITDGPFELLGTISTASMGKPDGIAVDAEGCVWTAMVDGGAAVRWAPDGEMLDAVHLPCKKITCMAFAGGGSTDLLVGTGVLAGRDDQGGSIFVVDARVAGAPVYQADV